MTERPTRQESIIVKTKAQAEDGWVLELDIPGFKSDYPTKVTRVATEIAAKFAPGQAYTVILEQQNQKQGKTGDAPWTYYWGLVDMVQMGAPQDALPPARASKPSPQPPGRAYTGNDDARSSIEAQVCLKEAVNLVVAKVIKLEEVPKTAGTFYGVLQTLKGGAPVQGSEAKTAGVVTPAGPPAKGPPKPDAGAGSLGATPATLSREDVMRWALSHKHGFTDVCKTLGVENIDDYQGSPEQMKIDLANAWGIELR